MLEMVERYRREDEDKPNANIVKELRENNRIKKKSILKVEKKIQDKHHLPTKREMTDFRKNNPPPCETLYEPNINFL